MPKLDARLQAVADRIDSRVHADIGSDHGHLLAYLLKMGRVERGIAVENKEQPFQNSLGTLAGLNAEVRLGDGLGPLKAGEVDSLSICGMGGDSIIKILDQWPDRVPGSILLQPNKGHHRVRRWAAKSGFWLVDELHANWHWSHLVIQFRKPSVDDLAKSADERAFCDPVYQAIDQELAFTFGPLIMKRRSPEFVLRMHEERAYYRRLEHRSTETDTRLKAIEKALKVPVAMSIQARNASE